MLTFIIAIAALGLAGFLWGRVRELEERVAELSDDSAAPPPESAAYRQMLQIAHDVAREYQRSRA